MYTCTLGDFHFQYLGLCDIIWLLQPRELWFMYMYIHMYMRSGYFTHVRVPGQFAHELNILKNSKSKSGMVDTLEMLHLCGN